MKRTSLSAFIEAIFYDRKIPRIKIICKKIAFLLILTIFSEVRLMLRKFKTVST